MAKIIIDGISLDGEFNILSREKDFRLILNSNDGYTDYFLPKTLFGLSIVPVLSLYDDSLMFADPTMASFRLACEELNTNLQRWVAGKSNIIEVTPRSIAAKKCYGRAKKEGWKYFCEYKKASGDAINSCEHDG